MIDRREFVVAATAGLAGLANPVAARALPASFPRRAQRILILGGTSFLGPHQVAYALNRGHSVTTFTRGRTAPLERRDRLASGEVSLMVRESGIMDAWRAGR